ncbi:hypothetical protein AC1031_006446 [Aphanomyces cochlioides]|nr:hypothetical protein AC1031_006446 [Aphanomyces cochlioides]
MLRLMHRRQTARPFLSGTWSNAFSTLNEFKEDKKRKVKVGLVMGYTGTGYHGVQIQEKNDVPTIEHEVRSALFKVGCILESNYGDMSKIGWSRSSRTDKGVHATSIVVSAKLLVHEERIDKKTGRIAQLVEDINVHLPENIRVFTATKVHQSFRAREECIMREYEYFLPVSFIEQVCKPVSVDKAIESVLETLPRFEGIYDFHNFTKQRRYFYKRQAQKYRNRSRREEDSSEIIDSRDEEDEEDEVDDDEEDNLADISLAESGERKILTRHRRTIYTCRGTLLPDVHGEPFICIRLRGASFLLNQIRLMVGAVLGVASGALPLDIFDAALKTNQIVRLPTAPAEGLVLSTCAFGSKQHLISFVKDHNTPQNLYFGSNRPNFAPHRVLVHPQELRQILRFRDEVIIKEIVRSWGNSDNVAKWPAGFESWKESLSEMDIPTITNALDKYLINEEEKLTASMQVVKQARLNEDSLKLLPRAFSTAVCIRFDLTPGVYVTDIIAGLKYCILLGKLSVTATQEDIMKYMERTGLDELAKLGRRGY